MIQHIQYMYSYLLIRSVPQRVHGIVNMYRYSNVSLFLKCKNGGANVYFKLGGGG